MHTTGRFDAEGFHELRDSAPAGLSDEVAAAGKNGGFVWVGVVDPGEGELDELAEELQLHPLAVADAASGKQQPKIQKYDEHLFVVMWSLSRTDPHDPIKISQVLSFVRDGLLITVQHTAGGDPIDAREVLEKAPTGIEPSAAGALYVIMSHIVAGYTAVADNIETELERLEERVFDDKLKDDARAIYRLRQQLGRVHRSITAAATSLETGRDHLSGLSVGHEKLDPYFRDLLDDLIGTSQVVSDQDAALDGVLASHENNVAMRQGDDTRKISAFAALLSAPAVLAGLYGMNFKNLPGVNWSLGWEVLIAAVIAIDAVLFAVFKRRKWL